MNHLIQLLLLAFLFLIPRESVAQETNEYSKVSFSLRAKYFYLPGWENVSWRSYSYGGEIFIGKHHAIGIDGDGYKCLRRWEDGTDDERLIAMKVVKRSSIYLDYKYIQRLNEVFSLYGQVYSRLLGKRMNWNEDGGEYEFKDPKSENYLLETKRGTFTDFGLGIGGKWYFNGGNSGLDVNLNIYKRFGSYQETIYSIISDSWSTNQVDDSKVSGYLRVAFFYHFLRFKR